jgi:hypothetical protein
MAMSCRRMPRHSPRSQPPKKIHAYIIRAGGHSRLTFHIDCSCSATSPVLSPLLDEDDPLILFEDDGIVD